MLLGIAIFIGLSISIGVKLAFVIAKRYDANMTMVLFVAAAAQAAILLIIARRAELMGAMSILVLLGFGVGLIYHYLRPRKPRAPIRNGRQ
ncbi:hypothetical protein A3C20_00225 [Candidatus Kaiserbacteria bacterium RIFCSPHIGHO2_02_FULL_55_25]|uniref:Uncharacterized protein n=1 Tax=Candidatus Kaiserbacteria bacterium RIFCSPHIGHO2_02_FULL_55_25 TaxID=1798498 RepID=A0A1F6E5V6_9BACT|nr:MAG: hypothetical protein A2764_03395 [Candidatus Kaiserbacteria bacterium RIFCSPHIGHO2_01_FULL_55_79]OGG69083.1 MAG: hypothetical protein A3C20_00225 [Candidatus Kaiserbacteria bacterium RIFCSPHIGHO2_02_FULL_55_25]OGG76891.1 MAG: hypothetical protein A3F56_00505 [Candidatus Kaiserbacteria bacterium RIFCSPHIGHO2_12_FULL_55_13]OGG84128.1 MAG: hypothetical protein A3A42_03755 [Candidatus Kaiserbacteria bacterium RIFCSPLOWO2_01_FULL_55_25]